MQQSGGPLEPDSGPAGALGEFPPAAEAQLDTWLSTIDPFEFFFAKQWSDGLPVVTPTEERVAWMLGGTQRDPDELIGPVPPAMEPATVRTVAIHAVMAGCTPEYLPVVLGGLAIMLRPEFNLNGVQGTMHGVAPLMIVNGPYAKTIGIHGGNGCFGPGFRANATIGRAIRLMLFNLGGGVPGVASATVFSTPLRYTACLTENLERSPYETLAVARGYPADADVITCAMVESPRLCYDDASEDPDKLLTGLADSMAVMCSWNMHVRSDMVVAMGPEHATICSRAGMTRADVFDRLRELAVRKVGDIRRGGNWRPERARKLGLDPDDDDCPVPVIKDPRDLHLIVAGGWGPVTAICHGWGGGSRAVHGTYSTG